ncbi:hypothetical protein PR048_021209 [Dryococelus australis]|uniref:Uncharacterized protein n=1 Tax=Dryococelus australis TaxID=614101 RepID=A0ABQ9GXM3_9NEOP|nr:hypothetical protein PR048_021209 [Dryococelus australis]
MRVIEVNMEQCRNEAVGETRDPRENSPTNRHDSHLRKSGWTLDLVPKVVERYIMKEIPLPMIGRSSEWLQRSGTSLTCSPSENIVVPECRRSRDYVTTSETSGECNDQQEENLRLRASVQRKYDWQAGLLDWMLPISPWTAYNSATLAAYVAGIGKGRCGGARVACCRTVQGHGAAALDGARIDPHLDYATAFPPLQRSRFTLDGGGGGLRSFGAGPQARCVCICPSMFQEDASFVYVICVPFGKQYPSSNLIRNNLLVINLEIDEARDENRLIRSISQGKTNLSVQQQLDRSEEVNYRTGRSYDRQFFVQKLQIHHTSQASRDSERPNQLIVWGTSPHTDAETVLKNPFHSRDNARRESRRFVRSDHAHRICRFCEAIRITKALDRLKKGRHCLA